MVSQSGKSEAFRCWARDDSVAGLSCQPEDFQALDLSAGAQEV